MLNKQANRMEESKTHSNGSHYPRQQRKHMYSHQSQNKGALIEIWRRTLKKWNPFDDNVVKPALILAHSYPIPVEIRSNVWFVISGALDLMRKNRNVFQHLSSKNSKCLDVIEKDLKRTFLDKNTNLKYEDKLRRILVAFSNLDPRIGYTQGMNYIAGNILTQYFEKETETETLTETETEYELVNENTENTKNTKNTENTENTENNAYDKLIEEKSFWTFVAIMNKIGTLFSDHLPGFHKSVECFKKLFNYHAPSDLVAHLNELNVYPIMLSGWYHSLFTYPSMNKNIAKRIWDVFIVEQLDFSKILKISYLIVIRHERQLMNMDFVEIIEFTKSRRCFIFNDKDDHDLIYRSSKLQLNELYLKPVRHLKYVDMISSNQNQNQNQNQNNINNNNNTATGDTIFVDNYNNLNISSSSIHSNASSSSSYVKLKSYDFKKKDVLIVPATKDDSNASKSWTSLLTFGFVK